MKQLFIILVILNLAIFAIAVVEKNKSAHSADAQLGKPVTEREHVLAWPRSATPQSNDFPDWIGNEKITAADLSRRAQMQQEAARPSEKIKSASEPSLVKMNVAPSSCADDATITINEDDYYRIKGLIDHWPHAAIRSVEQKKAVASRKTQTYYRVLLPGGVEQLPRLGAAGFSGAVYGDNVSVDILADKAAADHLSSRLSTAGIGGAYVEEQTTESVVDSKGLSVGRMTLIFTSLDNRDFTAVGNIIGRYGHLERKLCVGN